MKMAESLVALYIYIYIYISILLQKKENTRENSLGKIGFDFDAINIINRYIRRIGFIEEVIKAKVRLFRESLSFLCVREVMETKDKYA